MSYPIAVSSETLSNASQRHALADAAKIADWNVVFEHLEEKPSLVNESRPGGTSLFTPVHQIAYFNAIDQCERMLTFKPWLSLKTSSGLTASDIAERSEHTELADLLRPRFRAGYDPSVVSKLEEQLWGAMKSRVDDLLKKTEMKPPQLSPLYEEGGPRSFYIPVPGMYGGFDVHLASPTEVSATSWCRVAGGSGMTHRITPNDFTIQSEGFL
eukprot:Rmarinus@m.5043